MKQKLTTSIICSVAVVLAIVTEKNPPLQTSPEGLVHVANMEGCRLKAYQCSADKWTAGLGHTQGIEAGDRLTLDQTTDYFIQDVSQAEKVVNNAITQTPTQGEYDMMVSFVFNLGAGNFRRSTLLKKFNAGDHVGACNEYLRWVYVSGKNCRIKANNCRGIVTRRKTERNVCLNGWENG